MRNPKASTTETFEKRFRAYAAGAGATAAGLLALCQSAVAEIVVTQAHASFGGREYSAFPIHIEGTIPLTIINHKFYASLSGSSWLYAHAASGAGVVGYKRFHVAALKFGAVIGPANQFETARQILAFRNFTSRGFTSVRGPFGNTTDRFLGLKFELNGEVHYGWAGFSVVFDGSSSSVLTAYAYETEPNTPIYAGQSSDSPRGNDAALQPATLGVLALGSLGLDIWRKPKTE